MKKKYFLFLFFLKLANYSHIMVIPYPFYNREYPIPLTKKIITNTIDIKYSFFNKNTWEFLFNNIFFTRQSSRSYNKYWENKTLSSLFHGSDQFDISDQFPNQKRILFSHDHEYYKDIFKDYEYLKYDGHCQPKYELRENGYLFAFDVIKKISDKTTCLIQIRLPLIKKEIEITNESKKIQNYLDTIHDSRIYLDDENQYFKARLDSLYEKEILTEERSLYDLKKNNIYINTSIEEDYFINKEQEKNNTQNYQNSYIFEQILKNEYPESVNFLTSTAPTRFFEKKNIFAATKFNEYYLPTEQSIELYKNLKIREKSISNIDFKNILEGKFLEKDYIWNSYQEAFLAPLDIQWNFTKIFFEEQLIIQALVSSVIPLKKEDLNKKNNYLALGFFENHYAVRLGGQLVYSLTETYNLIGYSSWQYNFPKKEKIPAIFENQSAYGLVPLYLDGTTYWSNFYAALHLLIKASLDWGIDLGYQYIAKSGDTIIPESQNFYLLNGEKETLDYSNWKNYSQSQAHLAVIHGYYLKKSIQVDVEARACFHGKNTIDMKEISLRLGYNF